MGITSPHLGAEPQFTPYTPITNPVKETTSIVVERSHDVSIDRLAIHRFCKVITPTKTEHWLQAAPVALQKLDLRDRLSFLLLLSSLSYRYWGDPKWAVQYRGKYYDGSWGMIASLWRAMECNVDILNASYQANMGLPTAEEMFAGTTVIPRFMDRLQIIHEVGRVLVTRFGGTFTNAIVESEFDAITLLQLVTEEFPSFRDTAVLAGNTIFFYKKAQLLIADVSQTLESLGLPALRNVHLLTACADYKLPWILNKLGVLRYSDHLTSTINEGRLIRAGSREELEIRANTVWAVEYIRDGISTTFPETTAAQVNNYLWLLSQTKTRLDSPYHLTDTTFY
jgi:hypothetical protein